MGKNRLLYLDQMKGVAIFLMVMGHVLIFSFHTSDSLVQAFGVSNMPMFFYVSGFLSYYEMNTRGQFVQKLVKRCRRLVIPWISVTVAMCFYGHKQFEPTLLSFYWFFYMLILISVVFSVFEYFIARKIKRALYYVFSFLFLMAFVGIGYYTEFQSYRFPFAEFVVFSTSYFLGWCCRKYPALNDFCLNNNLLYVICIPLFIYGCCNMQSLNLVTRILAGNAGVLIWQSFFYNQYKCSVVYINGGGKNSLRNIIAYLGQSSLSIYMLNNFFIPDLTNYGTTFLTVENGFLWQFVVVSLLTLPVIGACVIVREMTKSNKYLKNIFN